MKNISWPDHFVSLFVVIFGISIAFFLENNRESLNLKEQQRIYTAGLIEDLNYNAVYLDTLNYYNDLIYAATSTLTDATLGHSVENDTLLAQYITRIQLPPIFLPQRSTYESLKSSGQMTLISDIELRKRVISLHEYYYEGAKVYDQSVSEHVRDYIKPYVINKVTYSSFNTINNSFLNDDYFQKVIFQYKFTHQARNEFYKEVEAQTAALLAELESLR